MEQVDCLRNTEGSFGTVGSVLKANMQMRLARQASMKHTDHPHPLRRMSCRHWNDVLLDKMVWH